MNAEQQAEFFGKDAAEWLKRWDEGRSVWSIEMGGLGPGYEQCIHITAAEILRHLLEQQYDCDLWNDSEQWKEDHNKIEHFGLHDSDVIKKLGLSGAQWVAAMNLAAMLYRRGPVEIMSDERVKDRHIQVQRTFPVAAWTPT